MNLSPHELKVSELLQNILDEHEQHHNLTLGKFAEMLHSRSYGIAILVLALPSILPISVIPGFSALFSIPILILSVQITFSMQTFWLPRWLKSKKLGNNKFSVFLKQAIAYIKKAEKWIRPRYSWVTHSLLKPLNGIILILLSFLLMLPIPFSNMIFGSLIAMIALGLIEKDGLVLITGLTLSCITIGFFYKALFTIFKIFFS